MNGIQPDESAPDALFTRFGRHLPTAWSRHLDHNIESLDAHDPLLAMGALMPRQQGGAQAALAGLRNLPLRVGLSHADLAPRNLIVAPGQPAVLIDWGSASFGPVPLTDLQQVEGETETSGEPTARERAAFTEAIATKVDTQQADSVLPALRLLQRIDLVRWAVDRRPDRLDELVAEHVAYLEHHLD